MMQNIAKPHENPVVMAKERIKNSVLKMPDISENTVKFLLRDLGDLTNRIHCNSQHEALMMVLSFNESFWPERISHNFLICTRFK